MRTDYKSLSLFFTGALLGTTGIVNAQEKPNIVFFLVDDMSWMDVACYGSKFYETPNIDRLARDGVKFTNAYAACHVSSPTRASIITGRYPASIGMTDWLPGRRNRPFQRLLNNPNRMQLPEGEATVAETLRNNGYRTAIIGKWHIGEAPYGPTERGFDEAIPSDWYACCTPSFNPPYRMNGYDGESGEYLTDRLTKEAVNYIEKNKDHPFFLYMAHFAVHDPIQGRKDLVEKYKKKLASMPAPQGEPYILEGNPDDENPLSRHQLDSLLHTPEFEGQYKVLPHRTVKIKQHQDNVEFAAMVGAMDESLGAIRNKLEELGIADNTIIIFMADNGGMSGSNLGNPNRVIPKDQLDGAFSTSNLPLRGGKGWLYEGGIREPLIVYYPGITKAGKVCDVPVISVDFYPTLMEMASATIPAGKTCDGVSIMPLIKGKKKLPEERALYWHFPHYSNHGMQSPCGAIRSGDYKLIEYFENKTVQLFNLKKDIGEQNDLSKSNPQKVKELRDQLHQWQDSKGVEPMKPNPDWIKQ
jgi:arylsulfatase A-like enzyme